MEKLSVDTGSIDLVSIREILRSHWSQKMKDEQIDIQLALYIPAMLGYTEKDEVDKRLNGVEEMQRFFESDKKLMLLLGDSGAGKSLFGQWMVNNLWEKNQEYIPLFIHIPSIKIKKGFLEKYLKKQCGLKKNQVELLRISGRILLILDAYDEKKPKYKGKNLHKEGELYRWNAKVIISCRTEALVSCGYNEQRDLFVPHQDEDLPLNLEWEKRYVQSFDSQTQIPKYIEMWKKLNPDLVDFQLDYLRVLKTLPNLSEMITNPFILWIVMAALPKLLEQDSSESQLQRFHLTRLRLFDIFTTAWFERQRDKLLRNRLITEARAVSIIDDYRSYCEQLANLMWQKNISSVTYNKHYTHISFLSADLLPDESIRDKTRVFLVKDSVSVVAHYHNNFQWCTVNKLISELEKVVALTELEWTHPEDIEKITSFLECTSYWDVFFDSEGYFNGDLQKPLALLRQGALLRVFDGNTYNFLHKSLLEYFSARQLFESAANKVSIVLGLEINSQLLTEDPARIRLGVDCVQHNVEFEQVLWDILEESKHDIRVEIAAANAITILAAANKSFAGKDLRRIRVRNAIVAGANFDGADLQEADFRGVNLSQTWLSHAKLSGSCVDGVQTMELLEEDFKDEVETCIFSTCGKYYVVVIGANPIVYETATHKIINMNIIDTPEQGRLTQYEFSRDIEVLVGRFTPHESSKKSDALLIGTKDAFFYLLNFTSKKILRWKWLQYKVPDKFIPNLHYSSNNSLAVSSSYEGIINCWDTVLGQCVATWKAHDGNVVSLAISSDNEWVVSGGCDGKIKRWNVSTGHCLIIYESESTYRISALAVSPDQNWILSGIDRGEKRIIRWSLLTGDCMGVWGHEEENVSVFVISSDSSFVLSGSENGIIKRWEVATGQCIRVLRWNEKILGLFISPRDQLAISKSVNRIKQWEMTAQCSLLDEFSVLGGFDISNNNHYLLLRKLSKFTLVDALTRQCIATWSLEMNPAYIKTFAISSDGSWMLLSVERHIEKRDTLTGQLIAMWPDIEEFDQVTALAISPDDKWVLSGSQRGSINKWDVSTGQSLWCDNQVNEITSILISFYNNCAFVTSKTYTYYNLQIMDINMEMSPDSILRRSGSSLCFKNVAVSLDGTWILFPKYKKNKSYTINKHDITGQRLSKWKGEQAKCLVLVLSPLGNLVLLTDDVGTVTFREVNTGKIHRQYKFSFVVSSIKWAQSDPSLIIMEMTDGSVSAWIFRADSVSLHLRWRSKLWDLHANECQLLGAYGLPEQQRQLFAQKGMQVQVSQKKSEAIIAQRQQSVLFNSNQPPICLFDGSIKISREAWAISIVRKKIYDIKKESDPTQHAFLILESIEEDYYHIRRIDFVLELRHEFLQPGSKVPKKTDKFGQGLIEIADKSMFDMRNLVEQCCARSSGITPAQGMKLLDNIKIDQRQPIGYCLMGAGAKYSMFRNKSAKEHHNCLSWCEKHLENIGVNLIERKWIDGILNYPPIKLQDDTVSDPSISPRRETASFKSFSPRQIKKEDNNNNNNEEPNSGSKCVMM